MMLRVVSKSFLTIITTRTWVLFAISSNSVALANSCNTFQPLPDHVGLCRDSSNQSYGFCQYLSSADKNATIALCADDDNCIAYTLYNTGVIRLHYSNKDLIPDPCPSSGTRYAGFAGANCPVARTLVANAECHVKCACVPTSAPTSAPSAMPSSAPSTAPSRPKLFDLDVELADVDGVTISLAADTKFDEAIVFNYNYTGAKPSTDGRVKFEFDILQVDCEQMFAAYEEDTDKALNFTGFNETVPNKVSAKIGIALDKIEFASEVWDQSNNDETQAVLKFCGRFKIFVEDNLFQFHEANVTAVINLKENGAFEMGTINVGLDRKDATTQTPSVNVEFPVNVKFCNDEAEDEESAPEALVQGSPIQVCLELATPKTGVYVASLYNVTYFASEVNEDPVSLINAGTLEYGATTVVDCTQKAGRCRLQFLAMAAMFNNAENNTLELSGLATIAFGPDPDQVIDRGLVRDAPDLGRRRVASSGPYKEEMRSLSDEVDQGGEQMTPFKFTVGLLQPLAEETAPKKQYGILFSVLGGILLVVVAFAATFFVKRRNWARKTSGGNPSSIIGVDDTTSSMPETTHEADPESSEHAAEYQTADL